MIKEIFISLAVLSFSASASEGIDSWIGSSYEEVVEVWGYPITANDHVNLDYGKRVYTYRTNYSSGSFLCITSFAFGKKGVIWAKQNSSLGSPFCPIYSSKKQSGN